MIRRMSVAMLLAYLPWTSAIPDGGRRSAERYVVIVNAANSVRELQREQLAAYFLKRRPAWPNGALVDPVDLPPDSPTRIAFSRGVLRQPPSAVSAYWIQEIFAGRSEPPQIKSSESAIVSFVASTPGAIGYVTAPSGAPPLPSTVRVLSVLP